MREKLPQDGANWPCTEVVPAEPGPPDFGWKQCPNEATHLNDGRAKCEIHGRPTVDVEEDSPSV